ncbi:MAG: hypothetical protein QM715_21310 [Nibricoccus sp.]
MLVTPAAEQPSRRAQAWLTYNVSQNKMTHGTQPVWSTDGENILSHGNLEAVRKHLDDVGNIAVEHWHYYGGRAPTPLAFYDFEMFEEYLKKEVRPGDAIDVYPFPHKAKTIASGKFPDSEGRVPKGGAY